MYTNKFMCVGVVCLLFSVTLTVYVSHVIRLG